MSERKPKPETNLQAAIVKAINRIPNAWARRLNSGGRRGRIQLCESGTPDIEVFLPGSRVLHIEVKGTKDTKVSPAQLAWHERADRLGHVVHVVRTVQEAVDAVVDGLRQKAAA